MNLVYVIERYPTTLPGEMIKDCTIVKLGAETCNIEKQKNLIDACDEIWVIGEWLTPDMIELINYCVASNFNLRFKGEL